MCPNTHTGVRRKPAVLVDQHLLGVTTLQQAPADEGAQNAAHICLYPRHGCRIDHTGNVLLVSSGGPISTSLGHLLGNWPETTIELKYRIRNSSLTEFTFKPKRHTLLTYNTLPHLGRAEYAPWIVYA